MLGTVNFFTTLSRTTRPIHATTILCTASWFAALFADKAGGRIVSVFFSDKDLLLPLRKIVDLDGVLYSLRSDEGGKQ